MLKRTQAHARGVSELSEIGPLSQDEVPGIPFDTDIQHEKRKYEEKIATLKAEVETLTSELNKARQEYKQKVDTLQSELSIVHEENTGTVCVVSAHVHRRTMITGS